MGSSFCTDVGRSRYYDKAKGSLYFYPNTTEPLASSEVVAPLLDTIVSIDGASDVTFSGFQVRILLVSRLHVIFYACCRGSLADLRSTFA